MDKLAKIAAVALVAVGMTGCVTIESYRVAGGAGKVIQEQKEIAGGRAGGIGTVSVTNTGSIDQGAEKTTDAGLVEAEASAENSGTVSVDPSPGL